MQIAFTAARNQHDSRPSLFAFQFNRVHLRLKENLDATCGPNGNACSKKVRIFGPYSTGQSECPGQHGSIILVTTAQALPGVGFKKDIEFLIDWFNDVLEMFDRR